MSEDSITKTQFNDWKEQPVTKQVFQLLDAELKNASDMILNGATIHAATTLTTEFLVGYIKGLNEILAMEYEETPEEKRIAYDN